MKTTKADFLLFSVLTMPKWAREFRLPYNVSVHDCINARAELDSRPKNRKELSLSNTINLLQLVRKNIATGAKSRTLIEYVRYLAVEKHTGCESANRQKWAIRFLRHIDA